LAGYGALTELTDIPYIWGTVLDEFLSTALLTDKVAHTQFLAYLLYSWTGIKSSSPPQENGEDTVCCKTGVIDVLLSGITSVYTAFRILPEWSSPHITLGVISVDAEPILILFP
jgi:hypothetical protein